MSAVAEVLREMLPVPVKHAPDLVTPDGAFCRYRPDPFSLASAQDEIPTGVSLAAAVRMMLRKNGLPARILNKRCRITVQAPPLMTPYDVPFRDWGDFMVRPGLRIYVSRPVRGGGGGKKNPLNVILSIVVIALAVVATVLAPYAAPAWWTGVGLSAASFGYVIGSAIMIGGMMLVNAVAPPSQQKLGGINGTGSAARTWSIDGIQNRMDQYGYVPWPLGKARFAPRYAANPYTYLNGKLQYARYVFACAGPCKVTDLRIGDTDAATYKGLRYKIHENWRGEDLEIFPASIIQEDPNVTLTGSNGWFTRTSSSGAVELNFELYFSRGLVVIDKKNNRTTRSVTFQAQYRPVGAEEWLPWGGSVAINAGTVTAPTPAAPATSPGEDYTSATTTAGFTVYVDEQGAPNLSGGTKIASGTSTSQWTAVYQNNAYAWQRKSTSVSVSKVAQVTSTFSVSGLTVTVSEGAIAYNNITVSAATLTAFRRGYAKEVPEGQYEFRIKRTTASANANSTEQTVLDDSVWSAFRSTRTGPVIHYDGAPLTVIELEIQASEQLNGHLNELNAMFESIAPVWNEETQAWEDAPTNNPASLGLLMAQSGHVRANVPEDPFADVDMEAFKGFWKWCEENNWKYNAVQTSAQSVREVLHNIYAAARGSVAFRDGKYSVVWDHPGKEVVYPFGPRNSWGFTYRKEFVKEQPHALRVPFLNETKDYQEDTRVVYNDGYSGKNATNIVRFEFDGVTDPDAIYQHARMRLAESVWRPATYELSTDYAYLEVQKGDRVAITHDVPMYGIRQARIAQNGYVYIPLDLEGYPRQDLVALALERQSRINPEAPYESYLAQIGAMDTEDLRDMLTAKRFMDETRVQGVYLDDHVTMEADKNYSFKWFRTGRIGLPYSVRTEPLTTNLLYFEAEGGIPVEEAPLPGGLVHFGEAKRETHDCIVTAVLPQSSMTAQIIMQDYSIDQIEKARTGPIEPWDSDITIPSRWQLGKPAPPVVTVVRTDEYVLRQLADGSLVPRIMIGFTVPERRDVDVDTVTVQVREHGSGDAWMNAGSAPVESGFVYADGVDEEVSYDVRLYATSKLGIHSDFTNIADPVYVIGRTTPPPSPVNLRMEGSTLYWDMPVDSPIDARAWEVWMTMDPEDPFSYAKRLSNPSTAVMQYDLSRYAGHARRVWVRTVDDIGLVSDPASYGINFGDMPVQNVVWSVRESARKWPGSVEGGVLLSGAGLVSASGRVMWGDTPMWGDVEMWGGETQKVVYTTYIAVPDAAVPSFLSLDVVMQTGTVASIEYELAESYPMWGDRAMWGDDAFMGIVPRDAWVAMPDEIDISGMAIIRARITTSAVSPAIISDIVWIFDVEDAEEKLNNLAVAADGSTRLPVTPRKFRWLKGVNFGLRENAEGPQPVSAVYIPGTETIENGFVTEGPFVYCKDESGNKIAAFIDATVQGAKGETIYDQSGVP